MENHPFEKNMNQRKPLLVEYGSIAVTCLKDKRQPTDEERSRMQEIRDALGGLSHDQMLEEAKEDLVGTVTPD